VFYAALVSIYFGLLGYFLSILTIFTTCLMLLKPGSPILRPIFKLLILAILLSALSTLYSDSLFSPASLLAVARGLSMHVRIILILMLTELSL
jgi:hypothetical protein